MAPGRLRALMQAHGLSQTDIATILAMSQSYVSLLLAGKVHASPAVRQKLMTYFRIDESLLFQDPRPSPLAPDCPGSLLVRS